MRAARSCSEPVIGPPGRSVIRRMLRESGRSTSNAG
jgi:hypothetical protein